MSIRHTWSPTGGYDSNTKPDPHADVTTQDIFGMLAGDFLPRDLEARRRGEQRELARANFRKNHAAYFAKQNTRELIDMLRQCTRGMRIWIGSFDGFIHIGEVSFGSTEEAALRAELATRPHIPNKLEARAIRQAKASKHRGQSKGKNR